MNSLARIRALDSSTLRAAWWTIRAIRNVRRSLLRSGLNELALPNPPELPPGAEIGVQAVFRRMPQTCLERALVLQRWYAQHGEERDVIIAVRRSQDELEAHAWVDGEPDGALDYVELMRVHAR